MINSTDKKTVLLPKLIHNRFTSKLIINIRSCKRTIVSVYLGSGVFFCSPLYSRQKLNKNNYSPEAKWTLVNLFLDFVSHVQDLR